MAANGVVGYSRGSVAGYSGTPLPKKLGIGARSVKSGGTGPQRVALLAAPGGFTVLLRPLPDEVQLDAGSILKAIRSPWQDVKPTVATIDLPTGPEEVSTRYSYSAHEDPPPPPPKPVRRHRHRRPKSEPVVHGCQYGPGDPDPRARHKVDLWR